MKYDFDREYSRRGTDSMKWEVGEDELPMWVGDMDFPTAPPVVEAIAERAKHEVYGYTLIPNDWYGAIIKHWKEDHGFTIERDWLCFCTGVVPAISAMVKRLTREGDSVVLMTPVYDIFFHSVENPKRKVSESRLRYEGGKYEIDFDDLESKLSAKDAKLLILCNPHNPVGKIWTKEELQRVGELCKKHSVTVISDEIHCDLTDIGYDYMPFAAASDTCAEISVTCISASKAFNLAGLQSAAIYAKNSALRETVVRGLNHDEVAEPNCFAAVSTVAAFEKGGEWLKQLREYLTENKRTAASFLKERLPMLHLVPQHATYMLWVDCSAVTDNAEQLCGYIRKNTGLFLSCGNRYRGNGNRFIRVNAACPRSRLLDGLSRLERSITELIKDEK